MPTMRACARKGGWLLVDGDKRDGRDLSSGGRAWWGRAKLARARRKVAAARQGCVRARGDVGRAPLDALDPTQSPHLALDGDG
eukprot:5673231-Pyramimonas_sp.AAC.1